MTQAFWFQTQDWLSDLVKKVALRIHELGGHPYLVGGAVRAQKRKELTGVDEGIKDFDVASDLPATVLMKAGVPGTTTVDLGTGPQYGVIAFAWKNPKTRKPEQVEVAALRCDNQVGPKRTDVEVSFTSSIVEDLGRRDLTFNAMAYDLITGEFFDPWGGVDSLRRNVVEVVRNAKERFLEDPLRMVRYFRFACRYDMEFSEEALEAMTDPEVRDRLVESVDDETGEEILVPAGYNHLSGERVGDEFTKILGLRSDKAARAFQNMMYVGLLDHWLSEVVAMRGVTQDSRWHSHNVDEHTFLAMSKFDPYNVPTEYRSLYRKLAGWILLLHDCGKPVSLRETGKFYDHADYSKEMASIIFDRMVLSRFFNKDQFVFLVGNHMTFLNKGKPSRMLARTGVQQFGNDQKSRLAFLELVYAIRQADQNGRSFDLLEEKESSRIVYEKVKQMISENRIVTKKELPVNGHDVIKIEQCVAKQQRRPPRKPHRWVGEVLDEVFAAEVDRQVESEKPTESKDEVRQRLITEIKFMLLSQAV
jgi:tRNA nucleotidyltransferase/poly(A) polymerase